MHHRTYNAILFVPHSSCRSIHILSKHVDAPTTRAETDNQANHVHTFWPLTQILNVRPPPYAFFHGARLHPHG